MAGEPKKILLVEDEQSVRDAVQAYLERENYIVVPVGDGQAAVKAYEKHKPDLIVLDLMLPKLSGERVCRAIREKSTTPIIMLTAKNEVEDRIIGLELGADDYLPKPFSPRELIARIRAILRRVRAEEEAGPTRHEYGDMVIDGTGHKILVKGKPVDLTTSEFKLLSTLAGNPGRVYTRMELVERVLGYDFEGYERTIDSHVKNLRAKIGDDPRQPRWIFTVHGVGYRFDYQGDRNSRLSENPTEYNKLGRKAVSAKKLGNAAKKLDLKRPRKKKK